MNEDRFLRAQVLNAFGLDPRLNSPRIRVAVDNATVLLTGDIGTAEAKRAAEHVARAVPGVRRVLNNLNVRMTWIEALAGAAGRDGHEASHAAVLELDATGLRAHHNGKTAPPPGKSET